MISSEMQDAYYKRSPYNIIRIILGKETEDLSLEIDKYKRAHRYLNEWLDHNVLITEKRECFYFYRQEFDFNGQKKSRTGLIAKVQLEEFSSKIILPHENTFPKLIEDRLKLLVETKANTEQIFLLYDDSERQIAEAVQKALSSARCIFAFTDKESIDHSLYMVNDSFWIDSISEFMKDKMFIIADGHHRYKTSLHYKQLKHNEEKKEDPPSDYIMASLFRLDDPGLVILPTHRLIKGLKSFSEVDIVSIWAKYFSIEEIPVSPKPALNEVQRIHKILSQENGNHIFACYCSAFNKFYLLRLKENSYWKRAMPSKSSSVWKNLDVAILHALILEQLSSLNKDNFPREENVCYVRNLNEGVNKVANNEYQLLFVLNPPDIHQISNLVNKGELMPERSTDFYPKLKSGIVMYSIE